LYRCLVLLTALWVLPAAAHAQGGNVFGPDVRAGDRTLEWRAMAALDERDDWRITTRLHYQHAFNDSLRLRGVAQWVADPGDSLSPHFARAELLWQYRERQSDGYAAALRFDARLSAEGAHRLGMNWAQQWDFAEAWRVRAILQFEHEIGAGAGEGVLLSSRARLSRRVGGVHAGLEAFARYGNLTEGLPGFADQRHTVGPAAFGDFDENWRWHLTSQFALTSSATSAPVIARIYRRF